MKKTNIILLLVFISSCINKNNDKTDIEELKVELIGNAARSADINLSFDGIYTYFLDDGKLIRQHNFEDKQDQVKLEIEENYIVDIMMGKKTIGVLCYDLVTAYNINYEKSLLWFEYDEKMNLVKRDTILSSKNSHLVADRMRYVSFYADNDTYFFNDEFGYCMKVDDRIWDEGKIKDGYVDINNGDFISLDRNITSTAFITSTNQVIHELQDSNTPMQPSINNERLAYRLRNEVFIVNVNTKKLIELNRDLNPIHSFKDGYYKIKGDSLKLYKVEIK